MVIVSSPVANDTARAAVLTRLCVELVNDSLTEYTYDADLAGLTYHVSANELGMTLTLKGYNDKLPELAKYVIAAVKNLEAKQHRLNVMKEKVGLLLIARGVNNSQSR